eukprot:Hpha_TRINITY_DN15428_c0_g1::TRINITY_DN15428_c0_g1_i3::g.174033::m.174033
MGNDVCFSIFPGFPAPTAAATRCHPSCFCVCSLPSVLALFSSLFPLSGTFLVHTSLCGLFFYFRAQLPSPFGSVDESDLLHSIRPRIRRSPSPPVVHTGKTNRFSHPPDRTPS